MDVVNVAIHSEPSDGAQSYTVRFEGLDKLPSSLTTLNLNVVLPTQSSRSNSSPTPLLNKGKGWSKEEETKLLDELHNNLDIKSIAEAHKRTIGGIETRRKVIAYRLYCEKHSIEDIICKTKLERSEVMDAIRRRQTRRVQVTDSARSQKG